MRRFGLSLCAVLILIAPQASSQSPAGVLPVVCGLGQPVVGPKQSVKATVLADAPDKTSLRYQWRADAGGFLVKGSGQNPTREAGAATVEWSSNGVDPGSYTLSATVTDAKGAYGSCSLVVMVSAGQRAAHVGPAEFGRDVGRALLVQGEPERKGFGLYSYMLIGSPPDSQARERIQKFIEAYLGLITQVKLLETSLKPPQLNITYLPVDGEPPDKVSADWILDHFDYGRARLVLSSIRGVHGRGPFIISSLHPLEGPGSLSGPYIFEDLANVPASVVEFWITQFMSQTSQQRFWEANTLKTVALNLRTAIGIAAEGLPEVRKAVAAWIVVSPAP